MTRDECVQKAEECLATAGEMLGREGTHALGWTAEAAKFWIDLGAGYIALARLADG